MQHTKITENPGEFQNFLDSDNKTGMYIEETTKFIDFVPSDPLEAIKTKRTRANLDTVR